MIVLLFAPLINAMANTALTNINVVTLECKVFFKWDAIDYCLPWLYCKCIHEKEVSDYFVEGLLVVFSSFRNDGEQQKQGFNSCNYMYVY